jgi:hypothetical protein
MTMTMSLAPMASPAPRAHDDRAARLARLTELRTAGLIRSASDRSRADTEETLPVMAALRPLIPGAALRRGSTVAVTPGATSLLVALLAAASAAGSWCAVLGMPRLGLVAAAEAGMALERVALIPRPGPEWADAAAALLDGVDIVVVAAPGQVSAAVTGRLTARARQRGAVLVAVGRWPGADLTLEAVDSRWFGVRQGRGRLRHHEVTVVVQGRGAAARARRARVWLAGAPDSAERGPSVVPLRPERPALSVVGDEVA